jgi:hypothetical protein
MNAFDHWVSVKVFGRDADVREANEVAKTPRCQKGRGLYVPQGGSKIAASHRKQSVVLFFIGLKMVPLIPPSKCYLKILYPSSIKRDHLLDVRLKGDQN